MPAAPLRTTLAALLIAMPCTVALPQEDDTAPTSKDPWQACLALDVTPAVAEETLEAFGTLFGKPALEWREEDYQQVVDLAAACHGALLPDNRIIDSDAWSDVMYRASNLVYPLAGQHQTIMARVAHLQSETMHYPICPKILDFEVDDWAFEDNSGDLFGKPLFAMSNGELRRVVDHVNHCLVFLPDYAWRSRELAAAPTRTIVHTLMDRALLYIEINEQWSYWSNKQPTDAMLEIDGYTVPPTHTSAQTQDLVERFNRAFRNDNLQLDTVYTLMSISEGILERNASEVDVLYAQLVRRRIEQDTFADIEP